MTKNNNFIEEEYGKLFTACVIIDEHGKQNESWLLISNLKNYGIDKSLYFAKYKFEQFISQKLQEQREELKKEIIELARQYQEQIQGGGNGRRIFEQFMGKIK
jgi:hypothetical protein